MRKNTELVDMRKENELLRKDCNALGKRCEAMEMAFIDYKSLYEIEQLKNNRHEQNDVR
jgi:hypothetical protein